MSIEPEFAPAKQAEVIVRQVLNRFIADECGASAIEYGLIVALISVAIVGVLGTLGINLVDKFQIIIDALFDGTPSR